ncbi:MFS transporter [Gallaecimonas kandeliae]|uniref:MFS transporter n=1 Tax=Gallaecimonas kandeliae TaxID=3029055 RepID=UPI002649E030|nr:MFS transporter [Gallaecimonas kandeliae]WKE64094.1 MFS transporter [Gallaecimonas kandeliae]
MSLRPLLLLLAGLLLLTVNIAVLNTLVPLWLARDGVATSEIGLVGSGYFVGNLVGTLLAGSFIRRLGFAWAYQLACLLFLLALGGLALGPSLAGWLGWRFLAGVACACIWVVVESWLMLRGEPRLRGRLLAAYMVTYYLGTLAGQLLLSVADTALVAVLPWVEALVGLAMLPVALAGGGAVPVAKGGRASPWALLALKPARIGVLGCVLAGVVLGCLYGLLPLYLARQHFDDAEVGIWMAVLVAAGILGQWPLGRLADRLGRLPVLLGQMALMTASALWLALLGKGAGFAPALAILGLVAFSLYPVAMAWACEQVGSEQLVAMNQGLLLAYCVGSLAGPAFAAWLMEAIGDGALFALIAALSLPVGLWCWWRERNALAIVV